MNIASKSSFVLSRRHLLGIAGLSYEDIATVTGCQLGTVRSRIHYAKRALRRTLEGETP